MNDDFNFGTTIPFQTLSEEEVKDQLTRRPSFGEWGRTLGTLALLIAVSCLVLFCAALTVHALVRVVELGWGVL